MKFNKNDTVTYTGFNRPYLNGKTGKIVEGPTTSNSYLVEFSSSGSTLTYSEWVGSSALTKDSGTPITEARALVMNKIRDLEKQISKLRSEVSKLNAANKALKDME